MARSCDLKRLARQSAQRDRRGRSHHSAMPVRSNSARKSAALTRRFIASPAATSALWPGAAHTSALGRTSTTGLVPAPIEPRSVAYMYNAAVYVDLLTGNVVSVADEKCNSLRDLLRRASRCMGNFCLDLCETSAGIGPVISVDVNPGATTLAVMLYLASSRPAPL